MPCTCTGLRASVRPPCCWSSGPQYRRLQRPRHDYGFLFWSKLGIISGNCDRFAYLHRSVVLVSLQTCTKSLQDNVKVWKACKLAWKCGKLARETRNLISAGVLSATRTIGKQAGNFSRRCRHSKDVRSSRRPAPSWRALISQGLLPCCWSMRTTPRPALAKCSLTMGSATFYTATWSKLVLIDYNLIPGTHQQRAALDPCGYWRVWKPWCVDDLMDNTGNMWSSYLVLFTLTHTHPFQQLNCVDIVHTRLVIHL